MYLLQFYSTWKWSAKAVCRICSLWKCSSVIGWSWITLRLGYFVWCLNRHWCFQNVCAKNVQCLWEKSTFQSESTWRNKTRTVRVKTCIWSFLIQLVSQKIYRPNWMARQTDETPTHEKLFGKSDLGFRQMFFFCFFFLFFFFIAGRYKIMSTRNPKQRERQMRFWAAILWLSTREWHLQLSSLWSL